MVTDSTSAASDPPRRSLYAVLAITGCSVVPFLALLAAPLAALPFTLTLPEPAGWFVVTVIMSLPVTAFTSIVGAPICAFIAVPVLLVLERQRALSVLAACGAGALVALVALLAMLPASLAEVALTRHRGGLGLFLVWSVPYVMLIGAGTMASMRLVLLAERSEREASGGTTSVGT